jgi:hypothetical protein
MKRLEYFSLSEFLSLRIFDEISPQNIRSALFNLPMPYQSHGSGKFRAEVFLQRGCTGGFRDPYSRASREPYLCQQLKPRGSAPERSTTRPPRLHSGTAGACFKLSRRLGKLDAPQTMIVSREESAQGSLDRPLLARKGKPLATHSFWIRRPQRPCVGPPKPAQYATGGGTSAAWVDHGQPRCPQLGNSEAHHGLPNVTNSDSVIRRARLFDTSA